MLCDKLQSGDTLIEVIVAMLLLGMIILGLVPLFSTIHSNEIMNIANVTAYKLAESQIEAIKSAAFDSTEPYGSGSGWYGMGTIATDGTYGDPPGQFLQLQISTYNGITYDIYTQIRWEPDPSRIATSDPTQADYKDITVEVKAQNPHLNTSASRLRPWAGVPYADVILNSSATEEYSGGELPGGNIYVEAKDPNGNPVANMTVYLYNPAADPATYEGQTKATSSDQPGEILFASLPPGTYTMIATDSPGIGPAGWAVMPGVTPNKGGGSLSFPIATANGQQCPLATYVTTTMTFWAAPACTLTITVTGPTGHSAQLKLQPSSGTIIFNQSVFAYQNYPINNLWSAGSYTTDYYTLTVTPNLPSTNATITVTGGLYSSSSGQLSLNPGNDTLNVTLN
jgi:type II secretory pathway pseudopilin PulG